MPIVVDCPDCKSRFRANDKRKGQTAPCPKCKSKLLIDGPWVSPYDVFISHSSKDGEIAKAICHELEEHAIRCWVAPRDIPSGKKWAEAIVSAIGDCRVLVLLISGKAINSDQVMNELEQAVKYQLKILPVRLEEVELTAELSYFVSRSHWMDAFPGTLESHFDRLVKDVRKLMSDDDTPAVKKPPGSRPATAPKSEGSFFRKLKRWSLFALFLAGLGWGGKYFYEHPEQRAHLIALISGDTEEEKSKPTTAEGDATNDAPTTETPIAEHPDDKMQPATAISETFTTQPVPVTPSSPPVKVEDPPPSAWNIVQTFAEHQHKVLALDFDADGERLLSASYDGSMKVLDLKTNLVLNTYQNDDENPRTDDAFYDANFSPDGNTIATGHSWHLMLWSMEKSEVLHTIPVGQGGSRVEFNANGSLLAAAGYSGVTIRDPKQPDNSRLLEGEGESLADLTFIPHSNQLAAVNQTQTIRIWNLDNNQVIRTILGGKYSRFETLAVSPDGTLLAAGGSQFFSVWNLKDGSKRFDVIRTTTQTFQAILFSPNGNAMLAGSSNGLVVICNPTDGEEIETLGSSLVGPARDVCSLAITRDGRLLAVGRGNGQVDLFSTDPLLHTSTETDSNSGE